MKHASLVLNGTDPYLPAYLAIDSALRASLAQETARHIIFFSEPLDAQRFPMEAVEPELLALLARKYSALRVDVVVAISQPALEFLRRHGEQLWPGARVVFSGWPGEVFDPAGLPPGSTAVVASSDFGGTIDLARRLQPDARRILAISGASDLDKRNERLARQQLAARADKIPVEFLSGLPLPELVARVAAESPDTIVLYTAQFRDRDGRPYIPREVLRAFSSRSVAPVYGIVETYLGFGMAAGLAESYEEHGRLVGQLIREPLAGGSPAPDRVVLKVPNRCVADARALQRWSLDAARLPDGCEIRFAPHSLWREYLWQIVLTLAVVAVQTFLIATLLLQRRSKRRTVAALAESEQRMDLAARAAGLSTWIWDVTRDRMRQTAQSRAGKDRSNTDSLALETALEAVHPADREQVAAAVQQSIAKNEDLDIEYRTVRPDGEVRWMAARGRVERGNGQRLLGVALDITDRKTAELEAERNREALRHMTRVSMLGQMSASIAHELNQPLAAILGNAEAAQKMLAREPVDVPELKEICKDIVTEDHRAAEVISRLRTLFKRGRLHLGPLDLNELIRETLDLVRTELLARQVVAYTDLAPSLPMIDGGRVQLQQVLLNLILNGTDAMNGIEPAERKLTIRTEAAGAEVRLCVIDCGIGIAAADLKDIFSPFWSTKSEGLGIGLAICRSIVDAHHGRLTAANNPGGGATFCVALPAREQA